MPELPEVETVRGGLEKAMAGLRIREVTVNRAGLRLPFPADMAAYLAGRRAERILRRGKYVVMLFDGEQAGILHLGMSGRVRIYAPGQGYEPVPHDHLVMILEDGAHVVLNDARRFGFFVFLPSVRWEREPPFLSMGPEPLEAGFDGPALKARLAGRKGPVKTALLDQGVVAGVGNIYACEALYQAGIDPARPAGGLSDEEAQALARAIQDVLARAIAAGGSTLKDYQKTDGSLGYFQYMFGVYDRAGQGCPDCDCSPEKTGGIRRIVQGGRSTFYCSRRQK